MSEIAEFRGEMLARLVLGRISGIEVKPAPFPRMGDLIVDVGSGILSVEVKASREIGRLVKPGRRLSQSLEKSLRRFGSTSLIPVLALIFDVSNDSGFFCWVVAPSQKKGLVDRPKELQLIEISDSKLEFEISRVVSWYQ